MSRAPINPPSRPSRNGVWGFVGYERVAGQRAWGSPTHRGCEGERDGARKGEGKQGGQSAFERGWRREERVKSGSPCTACASRTRSSFLHLQVERRPVRHRLRKRGFSICDIAVSGSRPPLAPRRPERSRSSFRVPSGSPGEKSFPRRPFPATEFDCSRNENRRLRSRYAALLMIPPISISRLRGCSSLAGLLFSERTACRRLLGETLSFGSRSSRVFRGNGPTRDREIVCVECLECSGL